MAYDVDLADRIREQLAAQPGLTEKSMFGGHAFLLDGHLTVSASGRGGLLLRVDPRRTDELLADPNAAPFQMRGRELDGWLHIAPEGAGTDAGLARWIELAVQYVRSLPPR